MTTRAGDPLPRRDLAWPCCIGKAFRIAENRVNRNARNCAPEDRAKHPDEVSDKPNEARHRHTQTEGKHAEENTGPQKLSCSIVCNLACGEPPDLAARPQQVGDERSAEQDHDRGVETIEVLDRAYEAETKHQR